ncbi:hypothetical protein ACH41H_49575 [Streptomyces sp. NPDC020800]|uniref:hypothetical protein n=1 Tax=Streptomyces sp. NPDC020800 TaxID=3365092 RepID=UPI0037A52420
MDLLGQLFGVTAMTISRAEQEVRPLLEAHSHHVNTSTGRLRTPADAATFLDPGSTQTKVKRTSQRSARPQRAGRGRGCWPYSRWACLVTRPCAPCCAPRCPPAECPV